MRRVILESPYGSPTSKDKKLLRKLAKTDDDYEELKERRLPFYVERNTKYARLCLRDSLLKGEAPIASHLLYTQDGVLDDTIPEERELGINAGLAWGVEADATVVYIDLGISRGMQYGIDRAMREGRPVEFRHVSYTQECTCQKYPTHQALDCHEHMKTPLHLFGVITLGCRCKN